MEIDFQGASRLIYGAQLEGQAGQLSDRQEWHRLRVFGLLEDLLSPESLAHSRLPKSMYEVLLVLVVLRAESEYDGRGRIAW